MFYNVHLMILFWCESFHTQKQMSSAHFGRGLYATQLEPCHKEKVRVLLNIYGGKVTDPWIADAADVLPGSMGNRRPLHFYTR